jgi:hypothetical protein
VIDQRDGRILPFVSIVVAGTLMKMLYAVVVAT